MLRKLLLTTVAVAAFAVPAMAAPTPGYNWTGFYVGGNFGANWNSSAIKIPNYVSSHNDIDTTAFTAGGKIGYNYQIKRFVLGAEGSMDWTLNKGKYATGVSTEEYEIEQSWQGAFVGKAGYVPVDNILVYGKGGLALANMTDMHFIPALGWGNKANTYVGWTAGAGIDYAVYNNWIAGVDYARAQYGGEDFTYAGPVSVRPTTDTVKASITYKFNNFR